MVLKLVVLVTLLAGISFLMKKGLENSFGNGMGKANNERWGINDDKEYHE